MQINGTAVDVAENTSLEQVLLAQGFNVNTVVVELNGAVITREHFASTYLSPDDAAAVLNFVGGG
jgi:sulfur carrier protein